MFKVCRIDGTVKFEFLNFSVTERVKRNEKSKTIRNFRSLTLSCRRPLSYRNQSTDLLIDWFLHFNDLRHERVKSMTFQAISTKAEHILFFR